VGRAFEVEGSNLRDGSTANQESVPNRYSWVLLIVTVVTILLIAPKSPTAPATGNTRDNAIRTDSCALLTVREISEVVGIEFDPGARNESGRLERGAYKHSYMSTCVWKAALDRTARDPSRPLGGARFAILSVMSWPKGSTGPARYLEEFRKAARSHVIPATPIPLQIADEALWWGDGVAARKGNFSFGISVHLLTGRSIERQMAESLASIIAGHL